MPSFITEEQKSQETILIIDKQGIIGSLLCEALVDSGTVVFVSKKQAQLSSVIHVPFLQAIPQIPDGIYSHILFVHDGNIESEELLSPILQKGMADLSNCLIILPHGLYSEKLKEKIFGVNNKANICILGDIFGEKQIISEVSTLIDQADRGDVQLAEMGLHMIYPVSFAKTKEAILHGLFGSEKKKIFFAFSSHPFTELSIAHTLQKVDPLVKIDFSNEKKQIKEDNLPEGKYALTREDTLKEIQEEFKQITQTKAPNSKEQGKAAYILPKKVKTKKHFSKKLIIASVFLVIIFSPFLLEAVSAGLGVVLLGSSAKQAEAKQFDLAAQSTQAAGILFSLSGQIHSVTALDMQAVGQQALSSQISANIHNGALISNAATLVLDGLSHLEQIQKADSFTNIAGASLVTSNIKQAALVIEDLRAGKGIVYSDKLLFLKQTFPLFANTADSFPSILGISQKKTYLVLFQNNMELRPGGGFIGSYALIDIKRGNVGKVTIHDIYDADGQLKGHIEPPFVLRRYIPVQHWFLRDSNFDVDWEKDAQNAAFFLKTETGQTVDGVIGIDLSFIKSLIASVGSAYVPEYNQTVNESNFFSLTESHAEKNFFPGSTQKKDFLRALFDSLQTKLMSGGHTISLFQAVTSSLEEKHILVSFADPSVQSLFTANGLSSSLWDNRAISSNKINDFVGINEANIGINKVNAFVTRSVAQHLTVSDTGSISSQLDITYKNTSNGQWPGGDYKNYLRLILPDGAQITAVAFDQNEQSLISAITSSSVFEAKDFTPPFGLEVDKTDENGKSIFGFVVTVPAGEKRVVRISYVLPSKLDISIPTFTYDNKLFKQPGVDNFPYTLTMQYPAGYTLLSGSSQNPLVQSMLLSKDEDLTFSFGKK